MSEVAGAGAPFDPAAEGWKLVAARGFPVLVGNFWSKRFEAGYRFGFLADERHANVGGVVHGGMLVTFVDDLLGLSTHFAVGQRPVSTIQLNTRFIAPARPGEFLVLVPQVQRVTRSVVFIRGEVFVGDRLILSADGVWKILGAA